MNIKKLLKNIKKEEFLKNYYNKAPLWVKNCNIDTLAMINVCEELYSNTNCRLSIDTDNRNNLFMKTGVRPEIDASNFCRNKIDTIPEFFRSTFVLSECEKNNDLLKELTVSIKNWLGLMSQVSAQFFYSGSAYGIGYHTDSSHVMVVQLAGKKTWHIGKCLDSSRVFTTDMDKDLVYSIKYIKGKLIRDEDFAPKSLKNMCFNRQSITLNPGDFLYLPPYYFHHTEAGQEASLALNMRFSQPSYQQIIYELINSKISSELQNTNKLKGEFPPLEDSEAFVEDIKNELEILVENYKIILPNINYQKDDIFDFLASRTIENSEEFQDRTYFERHFNIESKNNFNSKYIAKNPKIEFHTYTNHVGTIVLHFQDQIVEFDTKIGQELMLNVLKVENEIEIDRILKIAKNQNEKKELNDYLAYLLKAHFLVYVQRKNNCNDKIDEMKSKVG
ncbi:MAG: cupin-like domain-containing protein [Oligoflexales bacterium]|nr:cupin-like domain-containing protein [Oligoflexales bacterium]